jgi:hypothetical protein
MTDVKQLKEINFIQIGFDVCPISEINIERGGERERERKLIY